MAIAESIGRWAERTAPVAVVRGMETAGGQTGIAGETGIALPAGWAGLAELGIFSIGVPEVLGGAAGSVADVAVAAEQLAAVLAPGPVLPTLLAVLVLARPVLS